MYTDQAEIKSTTHHHYKILLTETLEAEDYANLSIHTLNMIIEEINAFLTRDIDEGEIIK